MSFVSIGRFFRSHELTRDAPLQAWARFAAWQIKSRLQRDVIMPWIHGLRLVVRSGMAGATGNIYCGLHEFRDMMLMLHFLRKDDLFLDIGSNVGTWTVLAAGIRKARCFAFEPDPDTAKQLRRNIEINNLSNVHVYEIALGRVEGEVWFTKDLDTINKVVDSNDGGARRVRQRRLDDVVGLLEPTMMKIDVEGHEQAVLEGAAEVLSRPSLKILEIETITQASLQMLASFGFMRVDYDPWVRSLSPSAEYGASNTFFVRDLEFVRERVRSAPAISIFGKSI